MAPSRRTPIAAILLGAFVLLAAIGLLVFVLVSGGDDSSPTFTNGASDTTRTTTTRSTSGGPTTTTTGSPSGGGSTPSGLTPISLNRLQMSFPSGWTVADRDTSKVNPSDSSSYFETNLAGDADQLRVIRYDVTPGHHYDDAMDVASISRDQLASRTGYQEITFERRTLATAGGPLDVVYWEFSSLLQSGVRTHSVDVFWLNSDDSWVALLTRVPATEWSTWSSTFDDVRASIQAG